MGVRGGWLIPPFSEEDRNAFTEASRAAWKSLAKEAGPASIKNYDAMVKALGEN